MLRLTPFLLFFVATAAAALAQPDPNGLDLGSPSAAGCAMVYHTGFALCYNEEHEQAQWVAYILTRDEAQSQAASRKNMQFEEDPAVPTGSATRRDYSNSGYDRGHLAPAADMKWSARAMRECFLMSNMSPQLHDFNAGIWEDLEHATRALAARRDSIVIIAGPVLEPGLPKIGTSGVSVPRRFFKVLLHQSAGEAQAIAFLMPHATRAETGGRPFTAFAVSVDSVEAVTGLDFFTSLADPVEAAVERASDAAPWFAGVSQPARKKARR